MLRDINLDIIDIFLNIKYSFSHSNGLNINTAIIHCFYLNNMLIIPLDHQEKQDEINV